MLQAILRQPFGKFPVIHSKIILKIKKKKSSYSEDHKLKDCYKFFFDWTKIYPGEPKKKRQDFQLFLTFKMEQMFRSV